MRYLLPKISDISSVVSSFQTLCCWFLFAFIIISSNSVTLINVYRSSTTYHALYQRHRSDLVDFSPFKNFTVFFFFFNIYLFIWLSWVLLRQAGSLVVSCELLVTARMWDLSPLTRDRTCAPALEAQSLNHWTTREVPRTLLFIRLKSQEHIQWW